MIDNLALALVYLLLSIALAGAVWGVAILMILDHRRGRRRSTIKEQS